MALSHTPHFVSVPQAAELLGCGTTKVYEYIDDRVLHRVRHGRRTVISLAELNAFCRKLALDAGISADVLETPRVSPASSMGPP